MKTCRMCEWKVGEYTTIYREHAIIPGWYYFCIPCAKELKDFKKNLPSIKERLKEWI